jgi:hypothetical protein
MKNILKKTNSVLVVLALGLIASWATLAVAQPAPSPLGEGRSADPAQFRVGQLDHTAVADTIGFKEFPVAWLGEEFAGYRLTKTFHAVGEDQNAVYLIYGDCEDTPDQPEPSCVAPLQIVTSAPGTVPAPQDERIMNAGQLTSARDATARTLSGSPFIWTDTVTITIHANGPFVAHAVNALRSANHAALGYRAVAPGDSLAEFGR